MRYEIVDGWKSILRRGLGFGLGGALSDAALLARPKNDLTCLPRAATWLAALALSCR
jgi:hypothetical protein